MCDFQERTAINTTEFARERTQLSEVQQTLERKLNSADARLHILLELIPDLGTDSDGNKLN